MMDIQDAFLVLQRTVLQYIIRVISYHAIMMLTQPEAGKPDERKNPRFVACFYEF
jgi:hypothetical protein